MQKTYQITSGTV